MEPFGWVVAQLRSLSSCGRLPASKQNRSKLQSAAIFIVICHHRSASSLSSSPSSSASPASLTHPSPSRRRSSLSSHAPPPCAPCRTNLHPIPINHRSFFPVPTIAAADAKHQAIPPSTDRRQQPIIIINPSSSSLSSTHSHAHGSLSPRQTPPSHPSSSPPDPSSSSQTPISLVFFLALTPTTIEALRQIQVGTHHPHLTIHHRLFNQEPTNTIVAAIVDQSPPQYRNRSALVQIPDPIETHRHPRLPCLKPPSNTHLLCGPRVSTFSINMQQTPKP